MNDFLCPKCRGQLRVAEHIIFRVRNAKKQTTMILLNPQIGNYSSSKHPTFSCSEGEKLEFSCPLCHFSFESDINEDLAMVIMQDEQEEVFEVYFSRICGEHSTYAKSGEKLYAEGEHAGKYTYFKIGNKFKKYF